MDSLKSENISLIKKVSDLEKRLEGFEIFKGESKGYDSAVGDYGTILFGIVIGITLLFGFLYLGAAKRAASDTFREFFDSYDKQIKDYTKELGLIKDKYEALYNISEDVDADKNSFKETITTEYHAAGTPK